MKCVLLVGLSLAIVVSHYAADARIGEGWLLTAKPQDTLKIAHCLIANRDKAACMRYNKCLRKLPPAVIYSMKKCHDLVVPHRTRSCFWHEPAVQRPGVPEKVQRCVQSSGHYLTSKENRLIVAFEDCLRKEERAMCHAEENEYDGEYTIFRGEVYP